MASKWETDSKVQNSEFTHGFPISSGEIDMQVNNSHKLLRKLVDTEVDLDPARSVNSFHIFLMTRSKTYIAPTMRTTSAKQLNRS